LCPQVVIPSKKLFSQVDFPNLVEKKRKLFVLPQLVKCLLIIVNFDLWMFKRAHDIFTLVVNFLDVNWQPKQVTIGLFEASKTTR
jgi:hypothetical protein